MAQYAPRSVTVLLRDYDCIVTIPNGLCGCRKRSYGLKYKADRATGRDGRGRPRLPQFLPQSGDVGIDDIRAGIEVHVPNFVVELTPRTVSYTLLTLPTN